MTGTIVGKQLVVKDYLRTLVHKLRKKGKIYFIKNLKKNASLLDVGCGNGSPSICKALRHDIYYVGIDIGDYNQNNNPNDVADEYILTTPDTFSKTIANFQNKFDAVISSHNLEHCNAPNSVLLAMLRALKPGGRIYLSFPCEASISFPKRQGLNFFDDSTHKNILNLCDVLRLVESEGFTVDIVAERNKPIILALIGMVLEPLSMFCRKVMVGTWELYGFESIIWATKISISPYESFQHLNDVEMDCNNTNDSGVHSEKH
jgi:SAM-dependent methyltransferase